MPGAAAMSLIRFTSPSEQRRGAQLVLQYLGDIPAVQTALAQIEGEARLDDVSRALRENLLAWFGELREHARQLEDDLRYEKDMRQRYEEYVERQTKHPLADQLRVEGDAHASTAQKLHESESALSRTEETLDRERRAHAIEIHQLQIEIAELNRLVAKQHLKLQELTGIEPE
jgi:SMC interacting uncharacterized protein involved in chromosome segregation